MSGSADSIFHARSAGISAEGVRDQYADGKAAQVWEIYIGDKNSRTDNYKNFLVDLLKKNGCKRILDAACGTGVDSILLLEEGFDVVSADASDKMLKYALSKRWNRRKEPIYDNWGKILIILLYYAVKSGLIDIHTKMQNSYGNVLITQPGCHLIEEANWLSLYDDIADEVGNGFDAVICLGNSFSNLLDSYGDQREHFQAILNFQKCLKPGGILLIDHRNYEQILSTGSTPTKSIYYNTQHTVDIKTSVLFYCGKPAMVTYDYLIEANNLRSEFRLSNYPHDLQKFSEMLKDIFGKNAKHYLYGDFKKIDAVDKPAFYIHVIEKHK